MNSTKWTQRIINLSKDEDAVELRRQQAQEADDYLEAYEAAIEKAAACLNREFPQVPASTWKAALNSPDSVKFTDENRKARFQAAQVWIGTQVK